MFELFLQKNFSHTFSKENHFSVRFSYCSFVSYIFFSRGYDEEYLFQIHQWLFYHTDFRCHNFPISILIFWIIVPIFELSYCLWILIPIIWIMVLKVRLGKMKQTNVCESFWNNSKDCDFQRISGKKFSYTFSKEIFH